jgi:hypothetical protein
MLSNNPIRVAIVAYEGISLLDLAGPLEALRIASTHPNHLGRSLLYECAVLSVQGGPVMTACNCLTGRVRRGKKTGATHDSE